MTRSNCRTPLDRIFWTICVFSQLDAFRLQSVYLRVPKNAHEWKKIYNRQEGKVDSQQVDKGGGSKDLRNKY